MKKILISLFVLCLSLSLFGCGEKQSEEPDTLGGAIKVIFDQTAPKASDCESIINEISNCEKLEFKRMVTELPEGYLPGFNQEISGFKKAVVLTPTIGSIAFVCYVFEVENPDAFLETLKDCADPRWNICVEANETVYSVKGNFVLFAMTPDGGEE